MSQISIHALHEESDSDALHFGLGEVISIHALHEESDGRYAGRDRHGHAISIHALHEESDFIYCANIVYVKISIHALHEESDLNPRKHYRHQPNFNPRSP